MRSPEIPPSAEIVRTYAQYEEHVEAFFQCRYQLLVVVGRPGLAKSHSFEKRLGPTSHFIKGWMAPLQAYIDSYRHRNKRLIFDDAEVLWKRPGGRILLRSLCEHKTWKLVQWASTARSLATAGVPQSFLTSSRVALIANRFVFGEAAEYEAVADRGHLIYFDPSPLEVHQRVGDWFWDQPIYDHIGERLHLLDKSSARIYLKAWERKQAGGDWERLIEDSYCHDRTLRILQALEADPACTTVEERVRKFIESTGACRATYFNLKRELKNNNQLHGLEKMEVPQRRLRGQPPVEVDIEAEVAAAQQEDAAAGSQGQAEEPGPSDAAPPCFDDPGGPADGAMDWWKRPHAADAGHQEEQAGRDNFGNDTAGWLRRELKAAVGREDYERAAELRDQIRAIEEGRGQ